MIAPCQEIDRNFRTDWLPTAVATILQPLYPCGYRARLVPRWAHSGLAVRCLVAGAVCPHDDHDFRTAWDCAEAEAHRINHGLASTWGAGWEAAS